MVPLDVEQLLPHRDRMRLIDEVAEVNEAHAVTRSLVRETWPLFAEGDAEPTVLIELVAQTAAAAQSWRRPPGERGEGFGWLVGIRTAEFFTRRLPAGLALVTEATYLYGLDDYHVYAGKVTAGGTLLAQVELQVLRSPG